MLLHLISLPHTQTNREYVTCAYTGKVEKGAKMFTDAGHEVILYSGPENTAPCAEHVVCGPATTFDAEAMPRWPTDEEFRAFNQKVLLSLAPRLEKEDLVLVTGGWPQKIISETVKTFGVGQTIEWAVGYEGIFSDYCCFESHAWRHYIYGKNNLQDGRWYDTVIPNFFDPDDFVTEDLVQMPAWGGEEYLLYVGRVTGRKGVGIAGDIAKELGLKLIVCGPGVSEYSEGRIVADYVTLEGDVHYFGTVNQEQRAVLMSGALALLAPTWYIEPFGGVAVEAMMCGTPALTSNWGAFTETVPEEFRFRTLAEGLECVERARDADRVMLRERALSLYSLEAVAPQYDRWFEQMQTLWTGGFYQLA